MIDHKETNVLSEVQARLQAVEVTQQEQAGTIAAIELEQRHRAGSLLDIAHIVANNYSALASSSQKTFDMAKENAAELREIRAHLSRREGEDVDFQASCLRAFGELGATAAVAEHERGVKTRTEEAVAAAVAGTPRERTVAWHIEEVAARLTRYQGLFTLIGFGAVFAILYLHVCGVAVKGTP